MSKRARADRHVSFLRQVIKCTSGNKGTIKYLMDLEAYIKIVMQEGMTSTLNKLAKLLLTSNG